MQSLHGLWVHGVKVGLQKAGDVFVVERQLVAQDVDVVAHRLGTDRLLGIVGVVIALLLQRVLVVQLAGNLDQLLVVQVVNDLLCHVLAVLCAGLHDSQQQLAGVVLQFPHQVHPRPAQWVDVVKDESGDDGQAVGLVGGEAGLVLVTRSLAVLVEGLHDLVDQTDVVLVDVQPEKPEPARGGAADAVQQDESLTHEIIFSFVVLISEKVLQTAVVVLAQQL